MPVAISSQAAGERPPQPSAEQIRAQLDSILKSKLFVQSERLCRFLRVAVERSLAGEADQIKEYMLGRDVFDRDHTYDPRVDSIVRVEARRLRVKLRQYYQDLGAADPVLINFRKGSYVPVFRYLKPANHVAAAAAPEVRPSLSARTVAVLPFLNLSPDPDQDFFCDGITEEILNALTTIPELSVVARTSVFYFKNKGTDVREIGEKLGAGTVIEGSVRKAENRLRVSAKAIDAVKGVLLWSGMFDRELADVFAVQDEIARAIAVALSATLAPSPDPFAAVRSAGNLEAYTLYLKGRYYWHQMSEEGIQAALNQFNRAVSLFPDYAPGYAGLADAYTHLSFWGAISPDVGTPKAKLAALEALRLDERLAEPRAQLGAITSCFEWRWEEGARLLKQASELQPSSVAPYHFYAFQLLCHGNFADAMISIDRCLQLDPLSPRISRVKGWAYYLERRFDQAIESLNMTLALDERNSEARFLLGYAYLRKRLYAEAVAEFTRLPEGPFSATKWGALGEAYAGWGRAQEAREALQKLDALAPAEYISPISRLSIYAGLGEWDRVIEGLEQAYTDHCPGLCLLKVDPRYDPIRTAPQVANLLERMHLM
jgi:serine/threonine-protein kinase